MLSLIVPVYKNEAGLDALLEAVAELARTAAGGFEAVFVVDGSPDRCFEILRERLPRAGFDSQLIALSRNFGSFSAIAAGLAVGKGDYFAVMAADLQEPPQLALDFLERLRSGAADVVFGVREGRTDPWLSELSATAFWWVYRKFVVKDMPRGGVDVFGCTREVRDRLLELRELNTNLIALLFWLGYRRSYIRYTRRPRAAGKSAWTFRRKVQYSLDSIFNFTDLPIQLLLYVGVGGTLSAFIVAAVLLAGAVARAFAVPDYAAVTLAIVFFGGLTSLGLGIISQYLWLTLQNVRRRPTYVVVSAEAFGARAGPARQASD
jgi:glycosyltransferase involved in cell wall biosynthesis